MCKKCTYQRWVSFPRLLFPRPKVSELYTKALQAYLQKYDRHQILSKLNQVYSQESAELDPVVAKMQFMSLPQEDW